MNKQLYKIEIFVLKVLPIILSIFYFIGSLFSILKIDIFIISYLSFTGVIPLIFIYLSSFIFKFCKCHRIPLYYIIAINILTFLDWIFIFSRVILIWCLVILSGMCIILTIYFKYHERK